MLAPASSISIVIVDVLTGGPASFKRSQWAADSGVCDHDVSTAYRRSIGAARL
jgi:hypothetical protein